MSEANDYDFDFNREGDPGHVWVRIDLGYGVSFIAYSDEPTSPREWTIDEGEVAFDRRQGINGDTGTIQIRGTVRVPYESDLGRALAAAWDRYVQIESRLPYAAGVTYGGNG